MISTDKKNILPNMLLGEVASPGIGRGRALLCNCSKQTVIPRRQVNRGQAGGEVERFDAAVSIAQEKLRAIQSQVTESVGKAEAEIFDTQFLLLGDAQLRDAVRDICEKEQINAEAAIEEAVKRLISVFERLEDPYFRDRAADLNDVGRRLLNHMAEDPKTDERTPPQDSIIVTGDILSSVVAGMEGNGVRGIIVENGSITAHATILARALGIPMLVQVTGATDRIRSGDPVIVDALAGRAFVDPHPEIARSYDQVENQLASHRSALKDLIDLPVVTQEGTGITLSANVGQSADAAAAANVKADGCGLYRTEFVFSSQEQFPSEEEQYRFYRATAEHLHPGETVIRILDIGSDKSLPYFPIKREANPALGLRGTRLLLEHPSILHIQLRAILRLSASHRVAILFPMIGGIEDLRSAKNLVEDAKSELADEGREFDPNIPVGAMIETPSAAILAEQLADEVDFFNVGTNDLVQYLLAADRLSDRSHSACDPMHPAVLQTLATLSEKANAMGTPICLCGEIAGDPVFTSLLIGLGYRSFSVGPGRILEVKHALRSIRLAEAEELAKKALSLRTAKEIKALTSETAKRIVPISPPEVKEEIS